MASTCALKCCLSKRPQVTEFEKREGLTPNPTINRTRRFMASTWRAIARRPGYLTR
jgi:hypothetical protein